MRSAMQSVTLPSLGFILYSNTCGWLQSESWLELSMGRTYASALISGWLSTCDWVGSQPLYNKTLQMYFNQSLKGDQILVHMGC